MIISLANQKGGTGKSTSAAAIASALRASGKKVLCIDAAPQRNLSNILRVSTTAPGIVELLQGTPAENLIQHPGEVDIIAGSVRLAGMSDISPQALERCIAPVEKKYQYIVIDTDCALNAFLLMGIFASNMVLIPMLADIGSLLGINDLWNTVTTARNLGADIKVAGAFFTQSNSRKTKAEKVMEDAIRKVCAGQGIPVYKTQIRRADAVRAAAAYGESIVAYDPASKPAMDYIDLLREIQLI